MAHGLTIGQVAETSGVAAKTIRYYEQIGVLPAPRRTASGYRLYDQRGLERLRFVRRARSLGLPLRQLRMLVGSLDGGPEPARRSRLRALVRAQLRAVTSQLTELALLRQQLELTLRGMRASRGPATGVCQCLETTNGGARRRGREARP